MAESDEERWRKACERARRWYAANSERAKEYQKQRRAADPEKAREYDRQRRAADPEKFRERDQRRRDADRERYRQQYRDSYARNREERCELERQRRAANPEKKPEYNPVSGLHVERNLQHLTANANKVRFNHMSAAEQAEVESPESHWGIRLEGD
jgi:hypothetical protein